jgi:hypothetical protein
MELRVGQLVYALEYDKIYRGLVMNYAFTDGDSPVWHIQTEKRILTVHDHSIYPASVDGLTSILKRLSTRVEALGIEISKTALYLQERCN